MRKLIATATAGLAITAGSIGLAVAGPLSGAFAQTSPSTTTSAVAGTRRGTVRQAAMPTFPCHQVGARNLIVGIGRRLGGARAGGVPHRQARLPAAGDLLELCR